MGACMRLFNKYGILIFILCIATISANCVQSPPVSPSAVPTAEPSAIPTVSPTSLPAASKNFTYEEKLDIINKVFDNPYVHDRLIKIGWRNIADVPVSANDVVYMTCHEVAPGVDVTRVLPAVVITEGNAGDAGINLIAFYDTGRKRVAYIGFVPRSGVPLYGTTITSTGTGVIEQIAGSGAIHEYRNVTIVDTGYVKGRSLSAEEGHVVRSIAVGNTTVKNLIGTHQYIVNNTTIYSAERGLPDRYIIAYPEVIIEMFDGGDAWDTIHVLVDGRYGRVLSIRTYEPWEFD